MLVVTHRVRVSLELTVHLYLSCHTNMLCVYLNLHSTLHHRQHYGFQSPHSSWCLKQEAVCCPRSFRDHPWLPNTALHLRDPHLSCPRPALSLSRLLSYLCHYRIPGHSIAQKADTNGRCLQTGRWSVFKGGRQWHTVPCGAKLLIQDCSFQMVGCQCMKWYMHGHTLNCKIAA